MNTKKMTQVRLGVNTPADLTDLERLLRGAREITVTITPQLAEAICQRCNSSKVGKVDAVAT